MEKDVVRVNADALKELIMEALKEYAPKRHLSGGMIFEIGVAIGFSIVALALLGGIAVGIFVGLLRLARVL